MYGFKNTECKIPGCTFPIWPNKTLGYCNRHYKRFNTGRMASDGSLSPLPPKTKKCESCDTIFVLKTMDRNVKFCVTCRPIEKRKLQEENNSGVFRIGPNHQKQQRRYLTMVLDKIIYACENDEEKELTRKNRSILDMRKSGKTYAEIAMVIGCSRQNIHQICSRQSSII